MLFNLAPHELLVIVIAFAVVVGGPIIAGLALAWVRRRRGREG